MADILGEYDVVVIGAGHAGCEAALAAARLGCHVGLFTISLDSIANMPCNPSIGGTAKGHLVREIDALGGQMGKLADKTMLQSRMLNLGKGPAVHSLRVQADRMQYHQEMKNTLELQPNLELKQAEIKDIKVDNNNSVCSVVTTFGAQYRTKAVIICTGTYLKGKIFVGSNTLESGPDGIHPAQELTDCLNRLGVTTRRFKTGTPARILKSSIDFSKLEEQYGDEKIVPFSFETKRKLKNKVLCHIAYTNAHTHEIILKNIKRSAMYSGNIKGVGPRYCPSIEDKIVRFAEKPRHQLFVESLGLNTQEMYIQGMSTSLPEAVQLEMYRSLVGFERAQIMRSAYAIEYDCCDPLDLQSTLEFKNINGLFGAGQFNGTSGYEEAAAQGLIAGINAALKVKGEKMLVLPRSSSYIGTLIDDLVTKGCSDPYRMMTSRSEYRLLLRQDNADERLTPIGYKIGLISKQRWNRFLSKQKQIAQCHKELAGIIVAPSKALDKLTSKLGTEKIESGITLHDILKRPGVSFSDLFDLTDKFQEGQLLSDAVQERVEIETKYEGYIKRQLAQAEKLKKAESKQLSPKIDYTTISGLRLEAQEKLNKIKPTSIGQAARISGVNPADITVLLLWLARNGK